MSGEKFEDQGCDTEIDALLRRTVPGEEVTSPDGDLIVRVRSIAFRRSWTDPGLIGVYVAAAVVLLAVLTIYTRPPARPPRAPARVVCGLPLPSAVTRSTVPVMLAAETAETERETTDMRIRRTPTGISIVFRGETD